MPIRRVGLELERPRAEEAAQFAPTGHVGEASAGIMFFIYTGALIGPALFSLVTSLTGTVTPAFLLLGAFALLPVPLLLLRDYGAPPSGLAAKEAT